MVCAGAMINCMYFGCLVLNKNCMINIMYLYKYTIKSKQTRIIKIKNEVGVDLYYNKLIDSLFKNQALVC